MLWEWEIQIYLRKIRYTVEVSVILVGIKQGKLTKWEIFSYSSIDYLCFDYYMYIYIYIRTYQYYIADPLG